MEFEFHLHKAASGIRMTFRASTLVHVAGDDNVQRDVSMALDVDERGMSADERAATTREVFVALHDSVVSMLAAAVGEAVPPNHELASPARRAAYEAQRAEKRAYREARAARFSDAVESLQLQTESCLDCGVIRGRRGAAYRCDHHEESFQAIREEFGPKSEGVF